MALYGKFYLNKANFAPLVFPGIGTFMAYSGDGKYRNQPGCIHLADRGAIPIGRYWIVARPTGGARTQVSNAIAKMLVGDDRGIWFALYRDDGTVNDHTYIGRVKRGAFRLHPAGGANQSLGCVTVHHKTDYMVIYNALRATRQISIPGTELRAFGQIEVIGNDEICPFDN